MGYREACEVARIRQELRDRLMNDRLDGAATILARLLQLAEAHASEEVELKSEYERWKMRFELLGAAVRAN